MKQNYLYTVEDSGYANYSNDQGFFQFIYCKQRFHVKTRLSLWCILGCDKDKSVYITVIGSIHCCGKFTRFTYCICLDVLHCLWLPGAQDVEE